MRREKDANAVAAPAATSPDEKCGILVTDIRPIPVYRVHDKVLLVVYS